MPESGSAVEEESKYAKAAVAKAAEVAGVQLEDGRVRAIPYEFGVDKISSALQRVRQGFDEKKKRRRAVEIRGSGTVIIAALAVAAGIRLLLRRRKGRRKGLAGLDSLIETGFQCEGREVSGSLAGKQFDIEDRRSRYAEPSGRICTADALLQLSRAGMRIKGRTTTEELHLGLLGDAEDAVNPAAPQCSSNGCSSGPAIFVANGLADVGIGADPLSGIRVQAALFGLSGFRPTPGHISGHGYTYVTGSSESIGWLVNDPTMHVSVAEAFKLPGSLGSFSNTELVELVIASEVFELYGQVGSRLRKIALAAAKRWAGADQTASGLLVTYLSKNVQSYKYFVGYDNDTDDVMEGILRAAVTLQYVELLQQHGHLLEEPASLRPSVLEQLERAQEVSEEEVKAAEQVAAETSRAMRSILRGVVLILPTLPCPQPAQGSDGDELKKWERGTLQLSALATLTGCPQATLPAMSSDGCPPLALSLLSLPKTDQRLAHVAAALGPLVQAASTSKPGSTRQSTTDGRNAKGKSIPNGNPSACHETAAQEALKEAGNEAFKAGSYQDAIEKYSQALKAATTPPSSVIYSNRAQALIKIGRFKEAEQDCTRALQAGPNAKALLRRGTARAAVSDLEGAMRDFQHVLALEPTNRQAKMELQNLKQLAQEGLDGSGIEHMLGSMQ